MKKKVRIIISIILILLMSIMIGIFYFVHPKDDSLNLADEDIIDISTSDSNINEVEQEPILPTETEVEVKEENTDKEDTSTEKTVSQISTTQTTSSESATSVKDNTQTNKNDNSKNTNTKPTSVQNSKPTNQSITKPTEKTVVASTPQTPTRCTNNSNHGMDVGNSEQWFTSKSAAIDYYTSKVNYWDNYWRKHPDESDKYYANCPYGHEEWSCMYCGKWTINLYYR